MIETPRSIARDGGWKVWPVTTDKLLQSPYRHHQIQGNTASPVDAYVLPLPMKSDAIARMGIGVPVGTEVWCHNVGDFQCQVKTADGVQSWGVDAHTTASFVLTSSTGDYGTWKLVRAGLPVALANGQPDVPLMRIDFRKSRNNVDLLAEAVARGYDGTDAAFVQATVFAGVVIGSDTTLVAAFTTGGDTAVDGILWHPDSRLMLRHHGYISGKGGQGGSGGIGGTGAADGTDGEDGGVGLRVAFTVLITSTGTIQGGGGGGGGGSGSLTVQELHGGGGGGGAGAHVEPNGFVNGGRGGYAPGVQGTAPGSLIGGVTGGGPGDHSARHGAPGSLTTYGPYGLGSQYGANKGGRGGNGGPPGVGGDAGFVLNDATNGRAAGGGGAAISQATGALANFVSFGTIIGNTVTD